MHQEEYNDRAECMMKFDEKIFNKKVVIFMEFIIFNIYGLLTVLLPAILAFAIFCKIEKRNGKLTSLRHFLMICIIGIYIYVIFHFTSTATIYDVLRFGTEHSGQYNLLPFSNDINMMEYLFNVFLFIPFGFLLPLIWTHMSKLIYIILYSISFSLLIEVSQLFNRRHTDIDDLIMNTIGGLLGYLTYKLFSHFIKGSYRRLDYTKYEPLIYISVMFMGRFFLYNELRIASIIWGF